MKKNLKKLYNEISNYDNIIVLLLIILFIIGIIFNVYITDVDELWNFQNIYKMFNGLEIYKDANVICTPLFFIIGELLFKIFGANFLVFRLYNLIICTILFFITYLIFKKLKFSKKVSFILIMLFMVYKNYELIHIMANYNTLALTFSVIGIYALLNNKKENNINYIIQGVITYLIFMTKQNIGIYYAMGLLFYELFINKNIKKAIIDISKEVVTTAILILFSLLIFKITGILDGFINYAVLGIKEFANENLSINLKYSIIAIAVILINVITSKVLIKSKKIEEKQINNLILLNCFAIPLSLTMVPILNSAHYCIGIYVSIILFVYIIKIIIRDIHISKKIINIILIIFIIACTYISTKNIVNWINIINDKNYYNFNHPYYGGVIEENLNKNINKITEFIKNNKNRVIVLSSKAALYMVPLNISNGNMDLPFKGNLGEKGENGLIEQIKKLEDNTIILIEKDKDNLNWQESKIVREYIENNLEYIGVIEEFCVFAKNLIHKIL